MSVKMIRLTSGEEIIANVEDGEMVTVSKPMAIIMQKDGLAMIPWLMLAEKPVVTLDKSNIMFSYVPKNEIVNAYNEQTGGIVTARSGILDNIGV